MAEQTIVTPPVETHRILSNGELLAKTAKEIGAKIDSKDPSEGVLVEISNQYQHNLETSKRGPEALLYRATKDAAEHPEIPGNDEITLIGLDGLHDMAGSEPYSLELPDVKKGDENALQEAQNKLKEDFGRVGVEMSKAKMKHAIEAKTVLEVAKDEAKEHFKHGDYSRAAVARILTEVRGKSDIWNFTSVRVAREVGGRKLAQETRKANEKSKEFVEEGLGTSYADLPPEERLKLWNETHEELKKGMDENNASVLVPPEDAILTEKIDKVVEVDRKIKKKQENLIGKEPGKDASGAEIPGKKGAIDADLDKSRKLIDDIRVLSVEKLVKVADVRVEISERRIQIAEQKLATKKQEFFKQMAKGQSILAHANLASGLAERVGAEVDSLSERAKRGAIPIVEGIKDLTDRAVAAGTSVASGIRTNREVAARVDQIRLESAIEASGGIAKRVASVENRAKMGLVKLEKARVEAVHAVDAAVGKAAHRFITEVTFLPKNISAQFWGEFLESDEDKAEVKQHAEALVAERTERIRVAEEAYQQKLQGKEHLAIFGEHVLAHVSKWKDAGAADVAPATPTPAAEVPQSPEPPVVEGPFSRPNMAFYEARHYKIGDNDYNEVIWVDRDNTVHLEAVDANGNIDEEVPTREWKTESQAEAINLVDKLNDEKKKDVEDKNGKLETGLGFEMDENGKAVITDFAPKPASPDSTTDPTANAETTGGDKMTRDKFNADHPGLMGKGATSIVEVVSKDNKDKVLLHFWSDGKKMMSEFLDQDGSILSPVEGEQEIDPSLSVEENLKRYREKSVKEFQTLDQWKGSNVDSNFILVEDKKDGLKVVHPDEKSETKIPVKKEKGKAKTEKDTNEADNENITITQLVADVTNTQKAIEENETYKGDVTEIPVMEKYNSELSAWKDQMMTLNTLFDSRINDDVRQKLKEDDAFIGFENQSKIIQELLLSWSDADKLGDNDRLRELNNKLQKEIFRKSRIFRGLKGSNKIK